MLAATKRGNSDSSDEEKEARETLQGLRFPARYQVMANELTESERKVGEYFLENPESAYYSILDAVNDGSLGYGTIIRFCRKMGCSGFQEFKVLLAQELTPPEISEDQDADEVVQYTAKIRRELADTEKLIDRDTVMKVCRALNGAGHVIVAGIAGSESPAIGIDYRLSRIGIHSQAVCEGYTMAIRTASLERDDVLIAVSYSGATKDILAAAETASRRGAIVVALTNFVRSPLVDLADFNLFTASDRDPLSCEVFSNVCSNFVLDVVFNELFRIRKGATTAVQETFEAISDRRV